MTIMNGFELHYLSFVYAQEFSSKNNNLGGQMKHIIALASKIAFTRPLYVILDRVYHASF